VFNEIKLLNDLFGKDLIFSVIFAIILSFIMIVLINVVKWLIENFIKGFNTTPEKLKQITDKLEYFLYPCLTILFAVPLPFIWKIDSLRYIVCFFVYIALNFLNYKFIYKMLIQKIKERLKGNQG
jgi:hypothetical protein